jgi:hypothetical protein
MARDAISRQYDVDKNLVTLTCAEGKGGYRPGLITFEAKKGKSIDLDKIRDSITATRLSGGTNMGVDYLEITAIGTVDAGGKDVVLRVSGTSQEFVLGELPPAKGDPKANPAMLQKLRDALVNGDKVANVTGRVQGWSGRFPVVLKALHEVPANTRPVLFVTRFEISKK